MVASDPGVIHEAVEPVVRPLFAGTLGECGCDLPQRAARLPETVLEAVGAGLVEHDVATQQWVPSVTRQERLQRHVNSRGRDKRPERPSQACGVMHDHDAVMTLEAGGDRSPAA